MRRRMLIPLAIVMLLVGSMAGALSAGATYHEDDDHNHGQQNGDFAWADPVFERTWERTDYPVKNLAVPRTWIWGPGPNDAGDMEPYVEAPGGMRLTQYTDKSRMEDNTWRTTEEPWDVTNGLLVVEMMNGQIQVGDNAFFPHPNGPSDENVAGDPGADNGPTYATMADVRDEPAAADGALLTQRLALDGTISNDPALASMNVTAAERVMVPGIDHQVASVFLAFMQSSGPVWVNDMLVNERLFINDYYATGYPVTEAYWADVRVGGTLRTVLLQCFERRCLTYTPGNPAGWLVEAGNVGQHYHNWRHGDGMPPLPEERLFVAHLTGDQENPPVATDATGEAAFFLSDDGTTLHYDITFENLVDVTMGHIHLGAVGVNGGVLVWLFPEGGPPPSAPVALDHVDGTLTAADMPAGTTLYELVDLMAAGETYANFHTLAHGGGEIRGQIMPVEEIDFIATLTNDQEIVAPPAVQPDTGASGSATLHYSPWDGTIACALLAIDILDVTMSHIHLAPAGANGGVITWLFPPTGPPAADPPVTPDGELSCETVTEDRLNISEAVEAQIDGTSLEAFVYQMLIGNTYVNVHTSAYPAGEIRGQIYPDWN
ncbi:MAG TPA: CHRD domain-containing protein [Thermomicrobiales bacterium]|nr:CHRD domain-containing protein [Thermomicrobiales bacterium]